MPAYGTPACLRTGTNLQFLPTLIYFFRFARDPLDSAMAYKPTSYRFLPEGWGDSKLTGDVVSEF
jgi:hypothetical protein